MRRYILTAVLSILVLFSFAQYPGYTLLKDDAVFKAKFKEASSKINSIKSDFTQEKNLSLLDDKISSKGKFWFRKENAIRMEYSSPFQYLMIVNGTDVYINDSKKENRMSAKSNKLFQQINKIIIDCVRGSALESKDFSTRIFNGSGSYLAELSPVDKTLKSMFKTITIAIDKNDLSVAKVTLNEPSGDNTIIQFVNRETNVSIPETLFVAR